MKRLSPLFFLFALILASCAPSEAQIAAALAQTQTAAATAIPLPTDTATPAPTIALTATTSAQQTAAWDTFETTIVSLVTSMEDVRIVHWVRMVDGVINIDFQTKWQAADNQTQSQYNVIKQLSGFCTNTMEQQIYSYTGVMDPSIHITTQSVDDLYIFESTTTFQQCVDIGFGNLNYKDWLTQAVITQTK
jgi:hypothetical protein